MAQTRRLLWFAEEPRGPAYAALLDFCAGTCVTASLVLNRPALPARSAFAVVDQLNAHVIERRQQSTWPGGGSLIGPHTVAHFRLNADVLATLKTEAAGLYDWVHPFLPEDLAFYRADGDAMLATIAHERCAYLTIDEDERAAFERAIPSLGLTETCPVSWDDDP